MFVSSCINFYVPVYKDMHDTYSIIMGTMFADLVYPVYHTHSVSCNSTPFLTHKYARFSPVLLVNVQLQYSSHET